MIFMPLKNTYVVTVFSEPFWPNTCNSENIFEKSPGDLWFYVGKSYWKLFYYHCEKKKVQAFWDVCGT